MATHSFRLHGETESYRQARNQLLQAEVDLRRRVEEVAAMRRRRTSCTERHESRIPVCLSQAHPDLSGMNIDRIIAEIEYLERIFAVPDARPLNPNDLAAMNRRHDEGSPIVGGFGCGSGIACAAGRVVSNRARSRTNGREK